MTTTTQLPGWGHYMLSASVKDTVIDFVNEYADDYDLDSLVDAYREAINDNLDGTGISLHGDDFYSTVPVADDAAELIDAAIENIDLGELAQQYDTTV